ncbi:MurR/RpiR family transcriptional regulator [Kurthia sibirica]|uniref:RpiR family transcriptional regulator n=1 Tax=Kurthia sibirica TaxID=202750 RepID=A0A2U3AJH6_9BACL|nr:MurR/RpiR family transcriptional regulator [Kurthia sibirica]PWI24697.1 RpiR family transcriptional regulator [Kurthia sibirica]GEK34539.1 RpiR family transcriptional regulator [Kurthia sibirica]
MPHSTFRKIQSTYPRLSKTDQLIADYITANDQQVVHMTISEVATQLAVADATIFRFCKRIGYNGFQDLKIALAKEKKPIQSIHDEISEQDDEFTIAQKVFQSNIQTLQNTLTLLTQDTMTVAINALNDSKRIYFFGLGGSAIIAMDGYHKFMRTNKPAFAFIDSHFQLMSASQLTKDDIAVIISHSGKNKDTLQILMTAKEAGAKTIAITSFPRSPIATKADITLLTSSEETEYRSEALASRIAQLSIIDALYVNLMVKNKEQSDTVLQNIRKAISKTRQ